MHHLSDNSCSVVLNVHIDDKGRLSHLLQTQAVFSRARSTQALSAQRRSAAFVVRAEAAVPGDKTVVIGLAADSGA